MISNKKTTSFPRHILAKVNIFLKAINEETKADSLRSIYRFIVRLRDIEDAMCKNWSVD